MWVESLRGQIVGLDTGPLIYFIERNRSYVDTVRPFFSTLAGGQFKAVTSMITLGEVLVGPFREGRNDLVERYREILLHSSNLLVKSVQQNIAEEAARIRAAHISLRTPDAIHLATAITSGARYFLTNDKGLPDLPNLQMLLVDNLVQT